MKPFNIKEWIMTKEDWVTDGEVPGEGSIGKSYLLKLEPRDKSIKYEVGIVRLEYNTRETGEIQIIKGLEHKKVEKYLKESFWMFNNHTFVYKQDWKVIGYMEIIE